MMQISLTKKLSDVICVKTAPASESVNPLFSWTANWTNTFDRRKEDMVVLVNNATRFTVSIYGVKRTQFKNITEKMTTSIRNTLLSLNLNPEVVDEYFRQAGEVEFSSNHDRKWTAQVNKQCLESAFVVGNAVIESNGQIKYDDTLGRLTSDKIVNYSSSVSDSFIPREKIVEMLSELTGKPAYKYRAFEICVTLDLDIYKAVRRLIVPADLEFSDLHNILQKVYSWKNRHLYDFTVYNGKKRESIARLVANKEDLEYDEDAILMTRHKLSDYLSQNKIIVYTYDMGDNWEHNIEFVREIEDYNEELPYILEAIGQAPPEDVGGVGGYINFREIMLDPSHSEYEEMKEWVGYWYPKLREWESRPRVIRY